MVRGSRREKSLREKSLREKSLREKSLREKSLSQRGYGWCYIKSMMGYLENHKQTNKCGREWMSLEIGWGYKLQQMPRN
jgi:hypothetical protein